MEHEQDPSPSRLNLVVLKRKGLRYGSAVCENNKGERYDFVTSGACVRAERRVVSTNYHTLQLYWCTVNESRRKAKWVGDLFILSYALY